jgi:hypothetical protein
VGRSAMRARFEVSAYQKKVESSGQKTDMRGRWSQSAKSWREWLKRGVARAGANGQSRPVASLTDVEFRVPLSRFLHAPAPPLPTHFVFASAGSVFIYANCLNYPPRHALVAVHAVDGSHSGATRHES